MWIYQRTMPHLNTLPNYTLSLYFAEVYSILLHCPTKLYLNTLRNYTVSYYIAGLYSTLIHCRAVPYSNTSPSAANQARLLRHPSCQPIRIEFCVTRELSAGVEDPSRHSAPLDSLQPLLKHGVFHPSPNWSAHYSTTKNNFIPNDCFRLYRGTSTRFGLVLSDNLLAIPLVYWSWVLNSHQFRHPQVYNYAKQFNFPLVVRNLGWKELKRKKRSGRQLKTHLLKTQKKTKWKTQKKVREGLPLDFTGNK